MTNNFDYSVRVKNGAGWRSFKRARLMISVGKEYHEGAKLLAVVDWLNRNPSIEEVHISVNDTLQRHNYEAAGLSPEQAANIASAEGTFWLERNEAILETIQARKLITRWSDWHKRKEFQAVHSELLSRSAKDLGFQSSIALDAHSLAERKAQRGEPVPISLVAHSKAYVEEEMAVFAMQTAELPAAEVYPGSNLHSAEYMLALSPEKKAALPEAIRPLGNRYFTRIDFARINVSPVLEYTAPRVA